MDFDQMLIHLEGVTVLEKPKVSREVLVAVVKEHTAIIRESKKEITEVAGLVRTIAQEAADNKQALRVIDETVRKSKEDIDEINRSMNDFRLEMENMNRQILELLALKQIVQDQGEQSTDLKARFEAHTSNMVVYINKTTHAVAALDSKNNDTQMQLRELKDYVEHFGDNIVLASSQITVESSAGFAERPISLLEVLKRCNHNITDITATIDSQEQKISTNTANIATKADESVLFDIDNIGTRVKAIETHLKREEEQGISAIRKTCDNLQDAVQAIQFSMSDKVARADVNSIVHNKYEDIVQYLQEALRGSEGEEESFNKKAEDLQEMVQKLTASKADRLEIAPMQEVLVKAEAMLSKLGSQSKDKDKLKELYTKKEIEAMMELKVDKTDFEEQLKQFFKAQKRNKKLSAMAGGLPSLDAEDGPFMSSSMPNFPPRDNVMWKGLADGLKDESHQSLMMRASMTSPDGQFAGGADMGGFGVPGAMGSIGGAGGMGSIGGAGGMGSMGGGGSMFDGTGRPASPAQFRMNSGGPGNGGGGVNGNGSVVISAGGGQRGVSGGGSMTIGSNVGGPTTGIGPGAPNIAGGGGGGGGGGARAAPRDFSNYVKAKKNMPAGKVAASMPLASNANPGAFKSASEGGFPGGSAYRESVADKPVEIDYYPNVPPDSKPGHDMSFLGGPYAGGGFNLRQNQLRSQGLKPMVMANTEQGDIEGSGQMLRGRDGKLYYTDQEGDYDTSTAGPNVRQLRGKPGVQAGSTSEKLGSSNSINDEIE